VKRFDKIKNAFIEKAKNINFSLALSPTNIDLDLNGKEVKKTIITHEVIRDLLYESLKNGSDTVIIAIDEFPDVLERVSENDGKQG
ncbi:hypothetical protein, partial [Pseudomonas sp. 65/3-MNA-CIBAN-0223]